MTRYKEPAQRYYPLREEDGWGNFPVPTISDGKNPGMLTGAQIDSMLLYGIAAQQLPTIYGTDVGPRIIDQFTQKILPGSLNLEHRCNGSGFSHVGGIIQYQLFLGSISPSVTYYSNALWHKFCAQAYSDNMQTMGSTFSDKVENSTTTLEFLFSTAAIVFYNSTNCSPASISPEEMGQSIYLEGNVTFAWATNFFDEISLRERIVRTITTLNKWHDAGEFDTIAGAFDGHDNAPWSVISLNFGELIFSLSIASQRLPASSDMQAYIEAYISHQYNTLLDNMTSTNQAYSDWNNTNSSEMDIKRRLSISYMLLAGIGMPETTQVNDTSQTETPPSRPETQARAPLRTIVGSSVGAVILIAVLISSCVIYNLRRRRNQLASFMKSSAPEPFTLEVSDKQLVTTNNAPRDWQLKDQSGCNWVGVRGNGTDAANIASRSRRFSSPATLVAVQEPSLEVIQLDEERDYDIGWRPSGAHRRLPPTYEDAM
ncbi:hypothetical protein VNI00_016403 [Paramarasmius palmivorus]|uniref:Glycoside hydrolase family 76 protein n=1 Tax=Paramarasmius palmivorus TaxID=297713 RepID=A0AAW0BE05_9AGAR